LPGSGRVAASQSVTAIPTQKPAGAGGHVLAAPLRLVAAGINDLSCPTDQLRVSQNLGIITVCIGSWLFRESYTNSHLIAFPAALRLSGTGFIFIWVQFHL
jgi:hypothetical protein